MSTTIHFDEFLVKYGDTPVRFSSYYKFTFTFTGSLPDGRNLYALVGGEPEEIRTRNVTADEVRPLRQLWAYSASVYDGDTEVECAERASW